MVSISRQEIILTTKYLVVKVGTNVLTSSDGKLNTARISRLVEEICAIQSRGVKVILVSSGAVGAGMGRLGLTERPVYNSQLQAVAAIGQSALIQNYDREFAKRGALAAQVLLTAGDLSNRARYLNALNTFTSLFQFGAVPIVNENDAISSAELSLTFGDNDKLASLVANLFPESLLVLLTDVDGLYTGDPACPESKLIPVVDDWSPELLELVAEKKSSRSKGGMASKLRAARLITSSGGAMIIANGDQPDILTRIYNCEQVGTIFFPEKRLSARKRWVKFAPNPSGVLVVDAGAVDAIVRGGKSLLPIGVLSSVGAFKRGDVVSIVDVNHREIARGLTNYTSREAPLICGKHTYELADALLPLGATPYEEFVHRNNIQLSENY